MLFALSHMRFYSRVALAVVFGLVLAHNILFFQYVYRSLSGSDGYQNHTGDILGGDFVVFYQAAKLYKDSPEKLYDFDSFYESLRAFGSEHGLSLKYVIYGYPPLFTHLLTKLPELTFFHAYLVWVAISATIFFSALVLLLRRLGAPWSFITLSGFAALAFVPFSFNCLLSGQTSACATAIFVLFYLLFERRRDVLAGMVLALSYYKPPLFVVLVLTLAVAREWRVLLGFLGGGVALVVLTVLSFGGTEFLNYIAQASRYRYGVPLSQGVVLPIDLGVGLLAALEGIKLAKSSTLQVVVASVGCIGAFFIGSALRKSPRRPPKTVDERDALFTLYTVATFLSLICSFQMLVYDLTAVFPFLAGVLFVALKRGVRREFAALFVLGVLGLYYESYYRSVAVGGVVLKGVTLAWLIVLASVWWLHVTLRDPRLKG